MASFIAAINKKQTNFYCQQSQPTLIPICLRQVFYFLFFFGHGESCHVAVACKYRPKQVWMWTTSCVNGSKLTG